MSDDQTPNNNGGNGATPPANNNGIPAGSGNQNNGGNQNGGNNNSGDQGGRGSNRGSDSRSGEGDSSDLIAALRREAADRRRDNNALTQSLQEAQNARQAAEQERDTLRQTVLLGQVRGTVEAQVAALKTPHSSTIAALVDVSKITVKDGKADEASVKAAIEAVKVSHPALFNTVAARPSRTLTNDAGAKSDGSPQDSHAAINSQIRRAAGRAG